MARLVLVLCVAVVMSGCIFCPDEAEERVWIEYRAESSTHMEVHVVMVDETGGVVIPDSCFVWPEPWGYEWPEAVPCGRRVYLAAHVNGALPGSDVTVTVYRDGILYLTATAYGRDCRATVEGVS